MRTIKTFAAALFTVGLLGSLPAIAHAGGGGFGGGPLTNVFLSDCYRIVGSENPPYTLDITDQFGDHQKVAINHARIVCVVSTDWTRSPSVTQPPLNPDIDSGTVFNAAKCYDVAAPNDPTLDTVGTVQDIFSTRTTTLKKMSMLCVPAVLEPAVLE